MKKIIIPVIVVLLVAIIITARTCGGGSKVSLEWDAVLSHVESIDSVELNVYVENSGSMDGYMCDGSNLKDAFLIIEINGLRAKVSTLTEEVNGLKYRLTLIDKNAVERLRNAKNAETTRADKAESEPHSLRLTYQNLLGKWETLSIEPEYNEAARNVKEYKEREVRLAAEKQNRYMNILNRFITEGRAALREFVLSNRTDFNNNEVVSIYCGIMAVAHKPDLNLGAKDGVRSAVNNFLDGLS